jgi:hypothetical protein
MKARLVMVKFDPRCCCGQNYDMGIIFISIMIQKNVLKVLVWVENHFEDTASDHVE